MEFSRPSRDRLPARAPALLLSLLTVAAVAPPLAAAGFQFPSTPNWESSPLNHYSTGCALRDLNGDSAPDLVVANGNDMARQPVVVYLNQGGTFPSAPTWTSGDVDYHGHLDLADVDGDGRLDLAVAVYLGAGGFGSPGHVKLYSGHGDGTFSSTPVWTSQDSFYCFSVAFGDVDMDGRPDLACATGESYDRYKERLRVYRNQHGVLGGLPYWQSADTRFSLDVTWGDVNGDGNLDLAFACESHPIQTDPVTYPTEVYFGTGTTLAATPGWRSQDGHDYSNTAALGDLNGDGWLDLAVADNNQLHSGTDYGRTKVFLNDGAGHLGTLPAWTSAWGGYGSHVSYIDADHDGDLDLAAGSWWGPARIYENQGGVLPTAPSWQSATGSVIENMVWEDVDGDGLEPILQESFAGDGVRKHFVLSRRPIRPIEVFVDGLPLPDTLYFVCPEQGWVTLGSAPDGGETVQVRFSASADLDFAVSNWDQNVGNYLFLRTGDPAAIPGGPAGDLAAISVFPNPAPGACRILLGEDVPENLTVDLFDVRGTRIRSWKSLPSGQSGSLAWDGKDARGRSVQAGTYWVRVLRRGTASTGRFVLLR